MLLFPLQLTLTHSKFTGVLQPSRVRVSLNAVARGTLDRGKTGEGKQAVDLWRAGKVDELAEYCRMDVELTRDVFVHGMDKGYVDVMIPTGANDGGEVKRRVNVRWK